MLECLLGTDIHTRGILACGEPHAGFGDVGHGAHRDLSAHGQIRQHRRRQHGDVEGRALVDLPLQRRRAAEAEDQFVLRGPFEARLQFQQQRPHSH